MMRRFFTVPVLFLLLLLCGCAVYQTAENQLELPQIEDDDFIIDYTGFTVNYDRDALIPHWVAYELLAEETEGEVSRSKMRFRQDDDIFVMQAEDSDYRNSGWSRGHMAPAADFKWSEEAMSDTFFFTNCCPQNSSLNNGMWKTLEKKVRESALRYGRVWVVTGPVIADGESRTIGKNGVTVPDAFFKAMLVCTGTTYQAVGFVLENDRTKGNLQGHAMSVNDLEDLTGYDFFPMLDDAIEETVESVYLLRTWGL